MQERIEILVLLSQDQDETLRTTAFATLQTWNILELVQVFSNPSIPFEALEFAANHLAPVHDEVRIALAGNPILPSSLGEWLKALPASTEGEKAGDAAAAAAAPAGEETGAGEVKRETLLQKIGRMTAAEKIKTALTGNQEERLLLIRDSNKIVARSVLQSPKLSDQEISNIASMTSVTEEVLRLVAMNRKFMKSYSVIRALINNPRTPIDVSLPMINRLNERDQKWLTMNKNVPEVIRSMTAKMIKQKEEAKKSKIKVGKH